MHVIKRYMLTGSIILSMFAGTTAAPSYASETAVKETEAEIIDIPSEQENVAQEETISPPVDITACENLSDQNLEPEDADPAVPQMENTLTEEKTSQTENMDVVVQAGFEGFRWGSNLDDVTSYLDNNDIPYSMADQTTISLMNATDIASCLAKRSMQFTDGKLTSGTYQLETQHTEPKGYYEDYLSVVDFYTKQFGTPIVNKETEWTAVPSSNTDKDTSSALWDGSLDITTRWDNADGNTVTATLSGGKGSMSTTIQYTE